MARIRLDQATESESTVSIKKLTSTERIKNSSKIFGIVFGLAVLSILIPVFHFVLVPTLVIALILAAINQFRKKFQFDLTGLACPKCKQDLKEKQLISVENKLAVYCFNCRTSKPKLASRFLPKLHAILSIARKRTASLFSTEMSCFSFKSCLHLGQASPVKSN